MVRIALGAILVAGLWVPCVTADEPVDYVRDIKPIFAESCTQCHGADKQRAMLRLDHSALILEGGESGPAVVPGKVEESLLLKAVTGSAGWRMPPEESKKPPLSEEKIALLKKWVEQGAKVPSEPRPPEPPKHWAFVPPVLKEPPSAKNPAWSKNPIDAFVSAKHEELKLTPAPPATKEVLIRRLYLDLIGLPPTQAQVRAFVADPRPNAYEKVVDQLLASPQYGQRWARHWMDIWRYSDWYGWNQEIRNSQYHLWRWRDWIVESLNADKGYDQMVREMLAGDEIAPTDTGTLRATGFLARNWFKFNRNVWLDNTIEHTGKAFLGLTINCARCHEHKYDPISHNDYYRFRAFFEPYDVRTERLPGESNVEKLGVARVFDSKPQEQTFRLIRGNEAEPDKSRPLSPALPKVLGASLKVEPVSLPIQAYYPSLQPFVQEETLAAAEKQLLESNAAFAASQKQMWEAKQLMDDFTEGKLASVDPLANAGAFLSDPFTSMAQDRWKNIGGAFEAVENRLQQKVVSNDFASIQTLADQPRDFHAKFRFRVLGGNVYRSVGLGFDGTDHTDFQAVYLSAKDGDPALQVFYRAEGKDHYDGKTLTPYPHKVGQEVTLDVAVRGQLLNAWVNGQFVMAYQLPAARKPGKLAVFTYDASAEFLELKADALPEGVRMVSPGQKPVALTKEGLEKAYVAAQAAATLAGQKRDALQTGFLALRLRIAADKATNSEPPYADAKLLRESAAQTERQAAVFQAQFAMKEAEAKLAELRAAAKPDENAVKAAEKMVSDSRKALETARDAMANLDEKYSPLGPMYPKTSTGRRLALANWIADGQNPLTARVAVNHIWLRHFGRPLVETVFDFGQNGTKPTDAQLLDYLAARLVKEKWSMKSLHKLVVMSQAYRMSSSGGESEEANAAIDRDNRFVWKQNVRRMEAEVVRDSVLLLAGKLDMREGGPELDEAEAMSTNRRSLYYRHAVDKQSTFMMAFDAAGPTECYRRNESVAPHQALAMVNSQLAIEQSRNLAGKISSEVGPEASDENDRAFIKTAYLRIVNRAPRETEMADCLAFLKDQASLLSQPASLTPFTGATVNRVKPSEQPHQRARENLVQVLFNHNDFVTIR